MGKSTAVVNPSTKRFMKSACGGSSTSYARQICTAQTMGALAQPVPTVDAPFVLTSISPTAGSQNTVLILSGLLPVTYCCTETTPTPTAVALNYTFKASTSTTSATIFLQPIGSLPPLPEGTACSSSSESACECFNTTFGVNMAVAVYPLLITFQIYGSNLSDTDYVKFEWSGNGYSGSFIDNTPDVSLYASNGYITATWNVYCNYETFNFVGQQLSVEPYNTNGETQQNNPSQIYLYTEIV